MISPGPRQPWSKIRQFPRYRTDVRVVITALEGHEAPPVHGRASVIAEGGFGATLAGELPVGQTADAELRFVGPGRSPLRATAVVRYRHGFRHGFQFLGVTPEQRGSIREFCVQLQPAD